ncbi:MAG: hypothetical protein ACLPY1_02170 [Terracidiphilus sp.]
MSETRFSHVPTIVRGVQRQVLLPAMLLASSSVLLLSGCGAAFNPGQEVGQSATLDEMHGSVHGGQSAVTGASVSIYEIGADTTTAAGYGAALGTALGTATTDVNGNWSMTPKACTDSKDELYLVASGGMEIGNTTANTALVLTSVGGPCGSQFTHSWNIDEVSTVVTEYALSGFATSYQNVGTSAGNLVGLTNAFATVNNLVNLGLGTAYSITPAYVSAPANTSPDTFRSIVPQDLINTLANDLSGCVNENDSGNGAYCTMLFGLTGGVSTTADAALYIAHNPGNNVSAILGLTPATAPFGPVITGTPTDLTMTVNYVGGGLGGAAIANQSVSSYLAIDQQGNVWVNDNKAHSVTELSNLGAPLSPNTLVNIPGGSTITKGGYPTAAGSEQIEIDQNGNAWVADQLNCLDGLSPTGTPLTGSPYNSGICPAGTSANGVAVDASNNIWVAGGAYITAMSYNSGTGGTLLNANFPYTAGLNTLSGAMGADYSGHMWYADGGSGEYGALNSNGTLYATTGSTLADPTYSFAFDNIGGTLELGILLSDGTEQLQLAKLGATPVLGTTFEPNSMQLPLAIHADGSGTFYFTNGGGSGIPNNVTAFTSTGTELSPASLGWLGGSGLMALDGPNGLRIDQSGNVWVINSSNTQNRNTNPTYTNSNGTHYLYTGGSCGNVTEFVGLAKPVNPVYSQNAATGAASGVTAAGAYGVAP